MIMLVSKCIYHTLEERKKKFIETIICMYGKSVIENELSTPWYCMCHPRRTRCIPQL